MANRKRIEIQKYRYKTGEIITNNNGQSSVTDIKMSSEVFAREDKHTESDLNKLYDFLESYFSKYDKKSATVRVVVDNFLSLMNQKLIPDDYMVPAIVCVSDYFSIDYVSFISEFPNYIIESLFIKLAEVNRSIDKNEYFAAVKRKHQSHNNPLF